MLIPVESLRKIRLYHFEEVSVMRDEAERSRADGRIDEAEWQDAAAEMHQRFVESLDLFFPKGDTAQKDSDSGMTYV